MLIKKKQNYIDWLEKQNTSLEKRIKYLENELSLKQQEIDEIYKMKEQYDGLIAEVNELKKRMNNQLEEFDNIKDAFEKELEENVF